MPKDMQATSQLTSADILAGATLSAHLAGRALPEFLPAEPNHVAAFAAATELAPDLLDTLAAIYEHRGWTRERLEREFFEGALAAWKPGTVVQRTSGRIHVLSPGCPIASEVDRDPRACQFCQAFQEQVARTALPGRVRDARFSQLASKGDAVCELEIDLSEEGKA